MGIARLREGIKWVCSQCNKDIPTGKGVQINYKPYCEECGERELEEFKAKVRDLGRGR